MFGIELVDLVPAGTIEDMVHANGPDLISMIMQGARKRFAIAADERISFQIIETVNAKGEPTVIMLPLVLDATTLQTKRKLPYYDVPSFLRTAPIAHWIRMGKETKKVADDAEKIQRQVEAAVSSGNTSKAAELNRKLEVMYEKLPADVKGLLGVAPVELPPVPAATPERCTDCDRPNLCGELLPEDRPCQRDYLANTDQTEETSTDGNQ